MLTCPFCRARVPDDSRFCDQCGKEFLFCPECGKPKRGTMCAACGADLMKADAYFSKSSPHAVSLVGEGLVLPLKEGVFGRRGGIWPDLGKLQYVSGTHGHIDRPDTGWTITDLGSTNGTEVNGMPLQKGVPVPLRSGDSVIIATYEFTVR